MWEYWTCTSIQCKTCHILITFGPTLLLVTFYPDSIGGKWKTEIVFFCALTSFFFSSILSNVRTVPLNVEHTLENRQTLAKEWRIRRSCKEKVPTTIFHRINCIVKLRKCYFDVCIYRSRNHIFIGLLFVFLQFLHFPSFFC